VVTALDDIVQKFRAGSPNIAAAFDEVQRLLLDCCDPPVFGADLFNGFEWAQTAVTGTVTNVSTTTQLRAAVAGTPQVIDGGGRTFALGGQLDLPTHLQPIRELRNCTLTGGRVRHNNTGKWRLRAVTISGPPVAEEDCVKGDGGGYLDIDGCTITGAPRQGILLAPHPDVVIRNSRVRNNGRDSTFDHGIYTAAGSRLLMFNNHFDNNKAYQLHMYPQYAEARIVSNTFTGGRGSILSGVTNAHLIGNLFQNSTRYGLEQLQPCWNVKVEDCAGTNNTMGGTSMGQGTTIDGWGATTVRETLWHLVPHAQVGATP
jgi:hypothetical protein